jgi:hypothetical protein
LRCSPQKDAVVATKFPLLATLTAHCDALAHRVRPQAPHLSLFVAEGWPDANADSDVLVLWPRQLESRSRVRL